MQRKLFSKFIQLIAIVLNTQLLLGPVALAQQAQPQPKRNFADYAQMFTGLVGNATQAYVQARQQGGQGQVSAIEAQLTPMLKIRPIDQRQVPPVFNGCLVLPASGTEMTGGMSCEEANDQQVMSGYTEAVINIAEFNKQQLKNYQTKGHERFTTQGVGCYEKKMEDFNGLLLAREEELSKLQNNLKERIEAFKLASRNDLEGMRQKAALLTGKPERYLKDVRFDEAFIGRINDKDKVCGSVFTKTMLSRAGKKGGYRAIEKEMFNKMTDTKPGTFSPEEMISKAQSITTEIQTLSNALAARVSKRADLQVNLSSTALNSKVFGADNKALQKIVNNFNNESKEELTDLEKELRIDQAVSSDDIGKGILDDIKNGDIKLSQRLTDYERLNKKECLVKVISSNWGSPTEFANGFKNPNVSNKMRNRADNSFATQIAGQINDPETTFEEILSQVNQFQKQGLNSSKIMITGKSFALRGKTVNASTPLRATQLIGILTDNCKREFDSQRNGKGFTRRDVVAKLQTYGNKVKTLRKTASSKLKSLLRNELIDCRNDTSTGVTDNSCGDALNINSPGFCVKTAKMCADNYKGCYDKAQTFVKATRDAQVATAQAYNVKVGNLKKSLKKDLLAINQFMETQARSLDGQLRMGTVFQVNKLDFNLNADFLYAGKDAQGLDEELNIEDPEKILAMADKQLNGLKKQLEGQRKEQMKKLADSASDYKKNYKSQEKYWDQVAKSCKQRNQIFDKADADRRKMAAESDAEISKACQELRMLNYGAPCEEVGDFMANIQEVMLKTPKPSGLASNYQEEQALRQLQQIKRECSPASDSYPIEKVPSDKEIVTFCNQKEQDHKKGVTDKEALLACRDYTTAIDSTYTNGACTEDIFYKEYNGKNFCKSSDGYILASNDGADSCSSDSESNNSTFSEDPKIKALGREITSKTEKVESHNEKLAETGLTEGQIDDLQKDIERLKSEIDELKNKIKVRTEELAVSNSQDQESQGVPLTKDNQDDIYSLLADLNSFANKTKCYDPNNVPDKIGKALGYATFADVSEQSSRQMGEHNISLAMCNGNYEGMFDDSGVGGAVNELGEAAGMFLGSRRE
jgi:hypothetical protein